MLVKYNDGIKMKIAFFLDDAVYVGGAGTLLLKQAYIMSKVYDVIVVIPCDNEGLENREYVRRCREMKVEYAILPYETSYNFYCIDYISALNSIESIRTFALEEKISFFHSTQLNIAVEYVARDLKIPHLMDIYQLKDEEYNLAYGNLYAQYHLCDSQLFSEKWSSKLGIESRCIRPVSPVDRYYKRKKYKKSDLKFLMLGSICERKNQLLAIKLFEKILKHENVTLQIAGDDFSSYAEECKNYVIEHHLEQNILFTGFINSVEKYLLESDCLICTSTDESFPSSIVEAISYDLTIISTPVAGVPEIFKNGENAIISKGYEKEQIFQSVMECLRLHDSGEINNIHLKQEETWNNYFAQKAIERQLENYYKYIVEKNTFLNNNDFHSIQKEICNIYSILKNNDKMRKNEMYRKSYYYAFLKTKIKGGKGYIWGAGNFGGIALELIKILNIDIEIIAVIDSYKTGEINGLKIYPPEELIFDEISYVFVCFANKNESAIKSLEQKKLKYNENIWLLP